MLAVLGDAGADVDNRAALDAENRRLSEVRETALSAMQLATSAGAAPTAPATPPAVRATPAARRLARERGVDLATLKGTGPGGMISVDDIP